MYISPKLMFSSLDFLLYFGGYLWYNITILYQRADNQRWISMGTAGVVTSISQSQQRKHTGLWDQVSLNQSQPCTNTVVRDQVSLNQSQPQKHTGIRDQVSLNQSQLRTYTGVWDQVSLNLSQLRNNNNKFYFHKTLCKLIFTKLCRKKLTTSFYI